MNVHNSPNSHEDARRSLRGLVLEYRTIPLALVDRVEPDECATRISQFALWLLDISIDTLRHDWQRDLHAEIRRLHVQRINKQPIAPDLWKSLSADSLAGAKLWPPEWLCASCLPSAPPIARTAAAVAIAQHRLERGNGSEIPQVDYRKLQADKLRSILQQDLGLGVDGNAKPEQNE